MVSLKTSRPQEQRISLRLWVFKFIDVEDIESFGVCVEGYRPSDDTATILRNWHSTAIERRISSSLLASRSGTLYELRGSIDKELAHQYGYPIGLVATFANGFPENWKSVLKEYFDVVKTTNLLNASHYFSMLARRRSLSTVRGHDQLQSDHLEERSSFTAPAIPFNTIIEESVQEKTLNSNIAYEDVHKEDTTGMSDSSIKFLARSPKKLPEAISELSSSGSSRSPQDLSVEPVSAEPASIQGPSIVELVSGTETRSDEPDRSALALVQVPPGVGRPFPLREDDDNAVELRYWSIRFAPFNQKGSDLGFPNFVILGTREGHPTQWQSSIVVRVESARILYTNSTKYRLVGEIDFIDCASAGFPKDFVATFLLGFPPDWRTQITRLYNSVFGHLVASQSMNEIKRNRDAETKHQLFEDGEEMENLQLPPSMSDLNVRRAKIHTQNPPLKDYNSYGRSKVHKKEAIVPVSEQPSSSVVRQSQSGRCIRTPLAEWAGQRVRYDGDGNVIGVEDVKTSTVHSKGVSSTLALSRHYGVLPSTMPRQFENYAKVSELEISRRPKRDRLEASATYRDNLEYENADRSRRHALPSSYDNEVPMLKHGSRSRKSQWEEDQIGRQLEEERLLLVEGARDLRKMQEKLRLLEQRIEEREAAWLRSKKKNLVDKRIPSRGQKEYCTVREREEKKRREKFEKEYMTCYGRTACQHDEDGKRYLEKRELERKRLEEEWARENEEISSESDEIDDYSWCEPVTKKKKPRPPRRFRKQSSPSEVSSSDNDEEKCAESRENHKRSSKSVAQKQKSWNKAELHRLKLALAAIRVVTDDDWEKVARSLGNIRTPESCKQAAMKRLKWEPPVDSSDLPLITSETVTARAGTIAYQHQTNEFTRKFMMGGGEQGDDFFKQYNVSLSESIADVADFGVDDSLLEVLRTPTDIVAQRKGPNRRQFFPEPVDDDDTPVRRRSSGVLMTTPTNSAQRERHDRYLHHIMNRGGQRNETSRLNYTRNTTRLDAFRNNLSTKKMNSFAGLHEDLENVAKMTSRASRIRDEELDNSDMELELDGNYSDFNDNFGARESE
ncbi:hypothetical protein GCK32_000343 [Trichostrongylus colubriformis]|uniref:SANTA domain-containing protein n=1 Tax=Trichostrongylus colubriformis TaxID=6319 RepID=A0AAN8GC37_TRICO